MLPRSASRANARRFSSLTIAIMTASGAPVTQSKSASKALRCIERRFSITLIRPLMRRAAERILAEQ